MDNRTAKLLWANYGIELWRTDTEYNVPKFHVFQNNEEVISTFDASKAIETVKEMRKVRGK